MDQNSMGGMPMPQPQNGMPMPQGMNNGMPMPQGMNNGMPMSQGMNNGAPVSPMGGGGMPAMAGAGAGAAPMSPIANNVATNNMPAALPEKRGSVVETIILVIVCIIAAGAIVAAVYFFMQWNDAKNDVDSKIALAVSDAQTEQKAADDAAYIEKQKEPFASFSGPKDYGSIYFEYPKTWNVYVSKDGNNSDFEAYFAAGAVYDVGDLNSRYALRFIIRNESFDSVWSNYSYRVDENLATMKVYSANDISGNLLTGMIDENINGQVLVAKINDKTLILQTDSTEIFESDFAKILQKLRRNK